jgi:hypothetical protein
MVAGHQYTVVSGTIPASPSYSRWLKVSNAVVTAIITCATWECKEFLSLPQTQLTVNQAAGIAVIATAAAAVQQAKASHARYLVASLPAA